MGLCIHFENILSKQKSLGFKYYEILNPGADKYLISNTQKNLDMEFNPALIELYSFADGNIHRSHRNNFLYLIPFYDFLSLTQAVNYRKAIINDESIFYNSENNYSPENKLLPFLEQDGGDCFWIDLNKGTENYGKIFWTTTLAQEPDYLFNSLESMFQTIDECYKQNIIFLDDERILSCNYPAWGTIAQKYNPDLNYWDEYNNSFD